MKTAIARLAILVLAAIFLPVKGQDDNTYVSNQSSRSIRATTIYSFSGKSDFVNRLITSGTYQGDTYSADNCLQASNDPPLHVQAWVDGATQSTTVDMACDWSLVTFDNGDKSGVDIYYTAYGSLNTPTDGVVATIYP